MQKKTSSTKIIIVFIISLIIPVYVITNLSAQIVKKKHYSIQRESRYKDTMYITLLPIEGVVSEKRSYLKNLLQESIKRKIQLYKKIRISESIIEFRRASFSGNAVMDKSAQSQESDQSDSGMPITKDMDNRFLTLKFVQNNKSISKAEQITENSILLSGIDIVVQSMIKQKDKNIDVNLKVFNNIYGNISVINKTGYIDNIEQLIDLLSIEIVKSIMVDYGYLNVATDKKDAVIYIDGRYFGRGDKKNILLESGLHDLVVSTKDKITRSIRILLPKNTSKSVNIAFQHKTHPKANRISVVTTPEKARIYIDSSFAGYSPIVIENLLESRYRLRLEKEGYITEYRTISTIEGVDQMIAVDLGKGISRDYYFSRTSTYNNLLNYSLLGATAASFSYIFFGLKIEDEKSKQGDSSTSDYSTIQKKIDKFSLYQNISLYSAISMLICSGVFFYLDIKQDDIAIAFFYPERKNQTNTSYSYQKGIGVRFTLTY